MFICMCVGVCILWLCLACAGVVELVFVVCVCVFCVCVVCSWLVYVYV